MARIALTNVHKTYPKGPHAVIDLSLDVPDGHFVVLVGPSGCGKSTTLRMIAGLEDPTGGEISIDGAVVNHLHPKDRDIAMVFQNYALYPHMTVRENLSFALRLRRLPKDEIQRRVLHTARMLDIHDLLDRKPRALSGGQRQRVALGRAIVRNPKAFLFDEPLSNLDARLRLSTRAELKSLHRRLGTTTLYVTHDQEEAMTLGDRVAVMAQGRLQQYAPPLDIYNHPANRFVAAFVGTPPMNFIQGTLAADGDTLRFHSTDAECSIPVPPPHLHHLRPHAGRTVVLGLRPHACSLTGPGHPLDLDLDVVEPLGDRMDLLCTRNRASITARVPTPPPSAPHPAPGRPIRLFLDLDQARWFEPGHFGRNLLVP